MHDAGSSWELPEDLRLLRETVRAFMAEKVRPAEQGIDPDAVALPPERLAPLQQEARRLGLWCVESPAEYGGAGLNLLAQSIVAEEASKCRMGVYFPGASAFGV